MEKRDIYEMRGSFHEKWYGRVKYVIPCVNLINLLGTIDL